MRAFNIFLIEMKKALSNYKQYIALYLLAPFLISFAYGAMYEKSFDANRNIPGFSIAVIDQDKGLHSQYLTSIFKGERLSKIISIKEGLSEAEAKSRLINGELQAAIVIPQNFTNDIEKGNKTAVSVIKSPSADMQGQIVAGIVNTYTDNIDSISSLYSSVYKNMGTADADKLFAKIQPEITSILNQDYITTSSLQKSKVLSSKQYYALTMLIMFSLLMISVGASGLVREREDGTLLRIKSTSAQKHSYIAGKFMWNLVFSLTVICTFIILSWAVNKVSWGTNPLQLIAVVLIHSFVISGLAVLAASVFKTQKSMMGILTIIIMVMASLGGTFYPTDMFPKALKTASHFTLNYWLQQGYSKLMLGTQLSGIGCSLLLLLLVGIMGLIIGSIKFKFDKSEVA